jgi:N-acyl-D-aspartate/D-glutamate deacylase
MGEIPAERIQLMTDMSLAAGRPLNWNLLGSLSPTQVFEQQLTSCDHARARGAQVVALALPDLLTMRSGALHTLEPWATVLAQPDDERRRAVSDPGVRRQLVESAAALHQAVGSWDLLAVGDGPLAGRSIASLAAERGVGPEEALIDAVVPDRQPVSVLFPSLAPDLGASAEGWQVRARVWQDERVVLGGSDAGAHCDLMCHANYPTVVLGEMTRERGIFDLEDAVRRMTDVPARLYGLRSRGRVAEGWFADLVVFDAQSVASGPATPRFDQPAGGPRLYAEAQGIDTVVVNGRPIVAAGSFTGDRPGTALRAGRDTETVGIPGPPAG